MRKGEAKRYLFYSLLLFVLAVLPSLHTNLGLKTYDVKRLCQLAVLLLGALMVITDVRAITSLIKMNRLAVAGMIVFFTLGLSSTWVNNGAYHSLQELGLYTLSLCLMFYVSTLYQQSSQTFTRGMGWLLMALGGLYALRFFIGYGMHLMIDYPLWPGESYQNPFFGFSNMRFLNQVQVWTLPLFVGFSVMKLNPLRIANSGRVAIKYIFFFLACFWWVLVIRTASAGAILCLFIAPCIILVLFSKKSHRYIKCYISASAIGFILKLLLFDLLTTGGVAQHYAKSTGMGRLGRWSKILVDMMHRPLVGFGPMSFAQIGPRYHAAHPHNAVLQLAYEFGLPAMFIILGLILFGLYKWFLAIGAMTSQQKMSGVDIKPPKNIPISISTALLAGMGYSLFSGVIVMPLSQLWMVLIGGWALGIYLRSHATVLRSGNKELSDFQNLTALAIKAVVLAAVVFMCYSLARDVPRLRENQHHYTQTYSVDYHPRFWQQGKIGLKK